jgi:hypothetical protein
MAEAFDHPKDTANGRYLCSPEHPMPAGAPGRWSHTNVYEVDGSQEHGWPSGDTVMMKCVDCGCSWRTELPQQPHTRRRGVRPDRRPAGHGRG